MSKETLNELYQQFILEHSKFPRNFGILEDYTDYSDAFNSLCGDHFKVYVKLDVNKCIEKISFEGDGCAISKASTSIMTELIKGKNIEDSYAIFNQFHEVIAGKNILEAKELQELNSFFNISKFPARLRCATLSWYALKKILDKHV